MEPLAETPRRIRDVLVAAGFVAFLCAPPLVQALRSEDPAARPAENRRLASLPTLPRSAVAWSRWPAAFEAWHDDHFGLRASFLRGNSLVKVFGLATGPSPRIVIGRERWIFPAADGAIDAWRGADPMAPAELEAWRRCLESRRDTLAERGIAYVFALAPSKPEIYPEYLPPRLRQARPSRLDQLVRHLERTSSFRVVDLREDLLAEKRNDEGGNFTYFPLGTHWTSRGAAAGLRGVVRELAKVAPEVARVDDTIAGLVPAPGVGDSWAERVYLPDLLTQRVTLVSFTDDPGRAVVRRPYHGERRTDFDQADASLPRAVILHDSFGQALAPMLARHFSHTHSQWTTEIDLARLDAERPDFVIHLLNDRVLQALVPQEFAAAGIERAAQAFDASRDVALVLDPAGDPSGIEPFHGSRVELRRTPDGPRVACQTTVDAGTLLLPEFELHAGTHPVVRLDFESPVSSTASVFFQTRQEPSYGRGRQLLYEVHLGANRLYIEIPQSDLTGRLLFRPAREAGTFLVSGLEVRRVGD